MKKNTRLLKLLNKYSGMDSAELVNTFRFQENTTGEGNEIEVKIFKTSSSKFYAVANEELRSADECVSEIAALNSLIKVLMMENWKI